MYPYLMHTLLNNELQADSQAAQGVSSSERLGKNMNQVQDSSCIFGTEAHCI